MKRVLLFVCILWLFQVGFQLELNNAATSGINFLQADRETSFEDKTIPAASNSGVSSVAWYAWQAAPSTMPIEDREHFSWWWWVIGVVLIMVGGVLLYFLIKKDPKHDVR